LVERIGDKKTGYWKINTKYYKVGIRWDEKTKSDNNQYKVSYITSRKYSGK